MPPHCPSHSIHETKGFCLFDVGRNIQKPFSFFPFFPTHGLAFFSHPNSLVYLEVSKIVIYGILNRSKIFLIA